MLPDIISTARLPSDGELDCILCLEVRAGNDCAKAVAGYNLAS